MEVLNHTGDNIFYDICNRGTVVVSQLGNQGNNSAIVIDAYTYKTSPYGMKPFKLKIPIIKCMHLCHSVQSRIIACSDLSQSAGLSISLNISFSKQ